MDRNGLLKEAEAVVLRGLAKGYAGGAKATPVPFRPGWKFINHDEDGWYLRDEYYVEPETGKSCGHTTLNRYVEDKIATLVWYMSYGGFYEKEAIPCLKAALMANYTKRIFSAGRGEDMHQVGNYRYIIRWRHTALFEQFSAHETIVRIDQDSKDPREPSATTNMGGHDIWGMALI